MVDAEPQPGRRWRRMLGPFTTRPHLTTSLIVGALVGVAGQLIPSLRLSTSIVLAWDTTCIAFVAGFLPDMFNQNPRAIRTRAATQDEGQGLILGVVITAAVVSLGAIGAELTLAKEAAGLERTLRVALAFTTVGLSWFMVQLIFALHYAHEYYAPDGAADGEEIIGGLAFPGGEPPDYWDFLHFAMVIGAAAQTADIAFTSKAMRRVGTVHCVLAFVYNTVVVALTINLLAALF